MYKLLLFLKKTTDEQINTHFNEVTLKHLSDIAGKEIKSAAVESNPLLDQKYNRFCEVEVESKEVWDTKMNTKEGKALNSDLMEFHQSVTPIFIDYSR